MKELTDYLISEIKPKKDDEKVWQSFKELISINNDLEKTLHNISLPEGLEKQIVIKTHQLLLKADNQVLNKIINEEIKLPLSRLLKYLNATANPEIKIITTNYDRIAEYAIDAAYINGYYGFAGSYLKYFNGFENKNYINCILLLKVHGSLDWFVDKNSNILSIPDSIVKNNDYIPLIVTPGIKKYEHTHNEPFRTIITKADEAFKNANSIICIGYGFNDIHIQPKLLDKIKKSKIPILIITKELTENTIKFIKSSEHENIIAISKSKNGSIIHQSSIEKHIEVKEEVWQLAELIKYII